MIADDLIATFRTAQAAFTERAHGADAPLINRCNHAAWPQRSAEAGDPRLRAQPWRSFPAAGGDRAAA